MAELRWFALLLLILVSTTTVRTDHDEDSEEDEDEEHDSAAGFPPAGCEALPKVCTFSVSQAGQKYKVQACLITNPHLFKLKKSEMTDFAKAAIKSMKSVDTNGKKKKKLASSDRFEVDQKATFKRGGTNFLNVEVKRTVGKTKPSVAHLNVMQKMIGVSPRKLHKCVQGGLYASLGSTKSVWIYQTPEYSFIKFNP